MKFIVSSTELLRHLQAVGKAISTRNTLPVLDNYLFQLAENQLTITASDLESTLITKMTLENVDGEGAIAVEAKRLNDILKEFSEQPLTFDINLENLAVEIVSENGKYSVVGLPGEDYPEIQEVNPEEATKIELDSEIMYKGITKTIFAASDDELRPVMTGIFIKANNDGLTFVASDSHKLVRYTRYDVKTEKESSFILPSKPGNLIKSLLPKLEGVMHIEFDKNNAIFTFDNFTLVARLIEGEYPNYESVIPQNNDRILIIDRVELYNSLRRVSVFSNQASNLVRLKLAGNEMVVTAQDIDFAISAYERLNCQYDNEDMEVGFKSAFLIEILSNLNSTEIRAELSEPGKAGLFFPFEKESEDEDILMLLMPMMVK
ncbi:MAG: DNA polymerase III subunit beta [Bacteroidales bacterium]|nr:DNA polymerase III subunit beta [Bacteroidales bacterium]